MQFKNIAAAVTVLSFFAGAAFAQTPPPAPGTAAPAAKATSAKKPAKKRSAKKNPALSGKKGGSTGTKMSAQPRDPKTGRFIKKDTGMGSMSGKKGGSTGTKMSTQPRDPKTGRFIKKDTGMGTSKK